MKTTFPQPPKKTPETAAEEFCREIRKLFLWLETAICNPESSKIARNKIHELRDEYHRARGAGYKSRRVSFADRVCAKAGQIVNFNPEYWTPHRSGQQFRRLNEWLLAFALEPYRRDRRLSA